MSARVPGEPTGGLSYGAHIEGWGGNGRDTETHLGPWLCGRTMYSLVKKEGVVGKRLLVYGG